MLTVHSLTAFYGAAPVVRDVSFTINEGEAVGVGGSNGAGKSTLLKAIVGLVRTEGRVELSGTPIGTWSTGRRIRSGIVYVPQERMVIAGLTVMENLRLFWLAGDRGSGFKQAIDRSLDNFPELTDRLGAAASSLSGGERQMLALSRALVTNTPRLVLLDEPSAGLAPLVINRISDLLRSWRERGLTYLLIEQNERLLKQSCERTLLLAAGELTTTGTDSFMPSTHDNKFSPSE